MISSVFSVSNLPDRSLIASTASNARDHRHRRPLARPPSRRWASSRAAG